MVDIFDEVSDDLRGERAARLLRSYGPLVIAAALLVLLGVAVQQGYSWYQTRRDDAAAETYLGIAQQVDAAGASLSNAQAAAAIRQFTQFAAGAPAGYRALARLRAAALYAAAGQIPPAAALWNTVGADGDLDQPVRDAANLLWAEHELGVAPDADVAVRLEPLAAADNPFHGLAREAQALLALREGKTDQAKALFAQIASDPTAPGGARNRAAGLLAKLNG